MTWLLERALSLSEISDHENWLPTNGLESIPRCDLLMAKKLVENAGSIQGFHNQTRPYQREGLPLVVYQRIQ